MLARPRRPQCGAVYAALPLGPSGVGRDQHAIDLVDVALQAPQRRSQAGAVLRRLAPGFGLPGNDGGEIRQLGLRLPELAAEGLGVLEVDPVCPGLVAAATSGLREAVVRNATRGSLARMS